MSSFIADDGTTPRLRSRRRDSGPGRIGETSAFSMSVSFRHLTPGLQTGQAAHVNAAAVQLGGPPAVQSGFAVESGATATPQVLASSQGSLAPVETSQLPDVSTTTSTMETSFGSLPTTLAPPVVSLSSRATRATVATAPVASRPRADLDVHQILDQPRRPGSRVSNRTTASQLYGSRGAGREQHCNRGNSWENWRRSNL
jgi:hypothetical protein